jgi:cytochrome P450
LVFVATGVTHFVPDIYREPHRFDPERFFAPRNEHHQPGVFAPYGLGGRTCLSAGMGESLIMLVIATLLHNVRFALPTPDYRLKTEIAPLPGPHRKFAVRVVEKRGHFSA